MKNLTLKDGRAMYCCENVLENFLCPAFELFLQAVLCLGKQQPLILQNHEFSSPNVLIIKAIVSLI
jgi:hypothetical protein